MNIFFNASIAGKNKYSKDYEIIIRAIKELGHTIYSDHIMKNECDRKDLKLKKNYREYSKIIKDLLNKSNIVVTETSFPSIMVGFILHLALQQRKHVLVLYQNNPHRILVGETNKLLTLKKYNPKQRYRLINILKNFFNKNKDNSLNIRFNLMIDNVLNTMLDKKSKAANISKANYIRNLMEEEINK